MDIFDRLKERIAGLPAPSTDACASPSGFTITPDTVAHVRERRDRLEALAEPLKAVARERDRGLHAALDDEAKADAAYREARSAALAGSKGGPTGAQLVELELQRDRTAAAARAAEAVAAGVTKALEPRQAEYATAAAGLEFARRLAVGELGAAMVREARALNRRSQLLMAAVGGLADWQKRNRDPNGQALIFAEVMAGRTDRTEAIREEFAVTARFDALAARYGADPDNLPDVSL